MKKSTKRFLTGLSLAFAVATTGFLTGCQDNNDRTNAQNRQPPAATEQFQQNAQEICTITVRLKQSRWSLDPFAHAKDAMNATEFTLPTACDTAGTLKSGDNLMESFRAGSLFLRGSLSDFKLTAKDVPQFTHEDETAYRVKLRLHQSRFSIDPLSHAKDWANAVEFYWDVPETAYEKMKIGDDLIDGGFRWGSLLVEGSTSSWALDVVEKVGQVRPQPAPKAPAPKI